MYRIRFEGVENIPPDGACIIVPNHVTFVDPIWITVPFRRPLCYMAWDKPFEIPVLGFLMRIFGAFPLNLDRAVDASAQRAAMDRLDRGSALVIFPEGGRSRSGKVEPFKMGAFRLALMYGAPILPVTLRGAYEVWPAGQLLPKLWGRITITYHAPISVERIAEETSRSELKGRARLLAGVTRNQIASALGESGLADDVVEAGQ